MWTRTIRRTFRDHTDPTFRPREMESTDRNMLDDILAAHIAGDRIEVSREDEGDDEVTNVILKHEDSTTWYEVTDYDNESVGRY